MATYQQQMLFINKIAPFIRSEAIGRGYHIASPIIAQACLESGYGLSVLASKYHNYFGMKSGSRQPKKSTSPESLHLLRITSEYTIAWKKVSRDISTLSPPHAILTLSLPLLHVST